MKKGTLLFLSSILGATALFKGTRKEDFQYTYMGEGDYWIAQYKISGNKILRNIKKEFTLIYKGDLKEIENMKELRYIYETTIDGGAGAIFIDKPVKEKYFTCISYDMKGTTKEDEDILVDIKWERDTKTTEKFYIRNINVQST